MVVIILLTMLVIAIPILFIINAKYVQRIALFVGISQIALLVFSGQVDNQLSDILVSGFNNIISFSFSVIIEKISLILFSL